jgi:UDP-2-acetamido-3-amino-2,3-dideoxy-glucuronate N-acetyltransferase
VTTFIHPQAICESDTVGAGTRIWAFAHVMRGAVVGADCNLGGGAFVESGAALGNRVTLKNQVMVWDGVTIGDDVFIGPGVIFTNDRFPRSPRMERVKERYAVPERWRSATNVARGASLGAGAVILPGVKIGEFAMVAAGAVVTRDVRPFQLVAGNPASSRGWVCACGMRLEEGLACGSCRAAYQLDGDSLYPTER